MGNILSPGSVSTGRSAVTTTTSAARRSDGDYPAASPISPIKRLARAGRFSVPGSPTCQCQEASPETAVISKQLPYSLAYHHTNISSFGWRAARSQVNPRPWSSRSQEETWRSSYLCFVRADPTADIGSLPLCIYRPSKSMGRPHGAHVYSVQLPSPVSWILDRGQCRQRTAVAIKHTSAAYCLLQLPSAIGNTSSSISVLVSRSQSKR